ncbi:MAG: GatB/YqeY domain-containing protein [Candidatus Parabeggiatoa sp. nov. 3]|nr:MAG: GatB/YqeY domain-containing protein [Gammaproteobacteria bacterium]RKZ63278.1 MAG: GatB/YqeY domain-containing protein [Gammaproteobacteria bacterium]RKZ85755.1 MAG: GatB/YqeY domain-containing protein [Gammaproteobacteria bacterium]
MSESLKQSITDDMKSAMRAKEKQRLGVIRLIQAAIKQQEVDERISLDDTQVIAVLDKMLKQRRDSLAQYEKAGRQDLADQEAFEIEVIQEYMPTPLSEAELTDLIEKAIKETGANSIKGLGKVMGYLKPKVQGRADMKALSASLKQQLSGE